MIKAVIYARVSSDRQEKEGFSIPAQLELLRNYALSKNIAVIKEFEDAETAKKAGRTNFNNMLKFLKEHKEIEAILVEKTDRLYRNFKDYVTLEDFNLEIHLVKEGSILSENSKSHEKFIHGIKVLMAKNYIDNLSEEIRKGQAQKVKEGYAVGRVPRGYSKINNRECIQNNDAPFIKRAFELYSDGKLSLNRVAKELYKEGYIFNEKHPIINTGTLEKILKTKFYYGVVEYRNNIYEGKHEPIISKALFDDVQIAFKKDNKPKYNEPKKFLFNNLFRCSECGCVISGEIKKGKYIYYSCTGGKHECPQEHIYVKEEKIEKQIIEILEKIAITEEEKQYILQGLKESHKEEQEFLKEKLEKLNKKKELLKDRISKIYLDKIDGKINEDFWLEKHNAWTDELLNTQNLITSYETTNTNYLRHGTQILNLLTDIKRVYLLSDTSGKQTILNSVLQNLSLTGENVVYTYKKPFDLFIKGANYLKNWRIGDSNS